MGSVASVVTNASGGHSANSLRNLVLVTHREAIVEAAERRHFRGVALVGPVARGENGPDSDVDFVVECIRGRSTLFGLGGLMADLRDLLGVQVM